MDSQVTVEFGRPASDSASRAIPTAAISSTQPFWKPRYCPIALSNTRFSFGCEAPPRRGRAALRREVRRVRELPDLQLALVRRAEHVRVDLHEALALLDGFLARARLEDREAADQLLRLAERPVDHAQLAAPDAHARSRGAGQQAAHLEQHAGPGLLLAQLADRGHQLLPGRDARLVVPVRLHQHHEPHGRASRPRVSASGTGCARRPRHAGGPPSRAAPASAPPRSRRSRRSAGSRARPRRRWGWGSAWPTRSPLPST